MRLQVLKWGEALHDYDVTLSEGLYTVVVRLMMGDAQQVIAAFTPAFSCSHAVLQLEDDYKHTVRTQREELRSPSPIH